MEEIASKVFQCAECKKEFASRITVGNLEDDFGKIKDADWIIEVVVERLDVKQQIFERVESFKLSNSKASFK